ncbi:MFS transporter [Streptomyces sp. TLI_171]|uniref:MFS transporter n=1 Tax=Streptomyces sp. TLI_171 TaxID=1938859 RepID=UPI000C18DA3F|nr:MFS transporter [Streptomyces sp. TLI_171]RKE17131.1 EmrB/QacA subfamily drug resistance transporter [Streptomyces sp. TLI_171]
MSQPSVSPIAPHPRRWVILAVVCLATLVVLVDNTVLNVAIPSLTEDLGAGTADVQWMINAYALVQSGLLLTAGSLADRYGRRRALLVGLALFGLGSTAAAFAQSSGQLIAARAGMGIGGALLMTTTLAVVVHVFQGAEVPKAIGIWGAVSSLGFAGGPLLGGVLLAHFWWGSIFLINVPVALLGLLAVARLLPESKDPSGRRPDVPGAVLSTVGMVGLVYAIISGPVDGWGSGGVLLSAAVGAAGLSGFVAWESRTPTPMLDLGFFRNRRFNGAVAGGILVAFGMAGSLFLLTQYLQLVLGYLPLQAALRMSPLALVIVALNLTGVGAKLLPRLGFAGAIALGMALLAGGLALIAELGGHGYPGLLAGLVLMGCGIAVANPAMAAAVMGAIPPERAGAGAGVQGTVTEFGGGLGVAVLGAVLGSRFAAGLPDGVPAGAARSLPEALAAAPGEAARAAVRDAFAHGLTSSQLIGAAAVLLGGLVSGALLLRAERGGPAAPAGAEREPEPAATP